MGFVPPSAYDRAITVFSPDGRIFQVEYAFEPVRKGTTAIGMACNGGVVLAVEERPFSVLQDVNVPQKLFQIDEHVGAAVAGLMGDARIMVDQARIYAQSNRLMYDEPIGIEVLGKRAGDIAQLYTQHAGVRPFGASIIFAGIDKTGSRVFLSEPSGAYWGFKAVAIGAGADVVKPILEKEYREDMNLDEAAALALYCLSKVMEGKLEPSKIKMAFVDKETKKFRILSWEEIEKYAKKANSFKAADRG
ncbi:archaeal proteasome endopeptidase complex subunit alpha [Candidatus Hecatella orcuttiae]|jgi:proteasome alpha subunit|uniref:archaeal proteasome endopeptidase complex subunit alpha n=1 Tax=Candidatus Hecatella orcuttiae TaxID=1935119 RepID=UPI002867C419|nr:archaeal proteasome endopeptidase complex subunit alpha [Candidatus Hecatella orcuttiae]